mgnify:CR=1 FL=1
MELFCDTKFLFCHTNQKRSYAILGTGHHQCLLTWKLNNIDAPDLQCAGSLPYTLYVIGSIEISSFLNIKLQCMTIKCSNLLYCVYWIEISGIVGEAQNSLSRPSVSSYNMAVDNHTDNKLLLNSKIEEWMKIDRVSHNHLYNNRKYTGLLEVWYNVL